MVNIMQGDCLELMPSIESGSVDMVLTSPPYDNLRTYKNSLDWGEHVWKPVIRDLFRVLKSGGVVVWVVADATIDGSETGTSFKQALFFIECGFRLHDTMIFQKKNPPPKNHNRYEQSFEFMFVFSKGSPKAVNLMQTQCKNAGKTNTGTMRNNPKDHLSKKHGYGREYKATKILPNIWAYGVGMNPNNIGEHPAVFPEQLAIDHILSWTNEGDLVFDPFAGSGTVGVASTKLNRNCILIEKESSYVEAMRKILENPTNQKTCAGVRAS